MASSTRLIVSILVIAVMAVAFWMLALSPKREKAAELGHRLDQLKVTLAQAESEATSAAAAKQSFPSDYRQLVVLGQAAPEGDETSSLLVELEAIAAKTHVQFEGIQLDAGGGESGSTEASASAAPEGASPTEVATSLLPLGASVGPAGLDVMPYTLNFKGDFVQIADLISELDSLVRTSSERVAVDGRLITISGFTLNEESERGFPHLEGSFEVTTYVMPPSQGITAGATPTEPATAAPEAEAENVSSETASTESVAR